MRKNVLVSILAVTSATPLTALANANVDYIKTDGDAWGITSSSNVDIENGMIVSPDGTPVSQKIGTLVPGKYKLAVTLDNAKILVNGKELDAEGGFPLDETTEVTITVEALVAGQRYTAGDFKLELVYDFATELRPLEIALAEVTNMIYSGEEGNETTEGYKAEASAISADIAKLKDDNGADDYELYVSYELYKGVESSTLMTRIKDLKAKVSSTTTNMDARDEANKLIKDKEEALKTVYDKIEALDETVDNGEGLKKYATTITKADKDAADKLIADKKKEVADAYEAGTAASVCDQEWKDAFTKEIDELAKAIDAAIEEAKIDHPAYNEVAGEIAKLKEAYNTTLQNVYTALQDDEAHPGVFEELRTEAQTKLNEVFVDIAVVEKANGTAESHTSADENKAANLANLAKYGTEIANLETEYTKKVNTIKTNYAAAINAKKGLEDGLKPLTEIADVAEKYAEEIKKIQDAITKLGEDIEAAYASPYDIETKNFDEEVAAIDADIAKLVTESGGSVANYEAYTAVTKRVAEIQKSFDDAKAAVYKLASEDGKYKAEGKYPKTEGDIQKALTGYLTDAKKAYDGGTCTAWQTENSAKMDATASDIADYQADAEAALEAYEASVAKIDEYKKAVDALDMVVDNGLVTVYAQTGKTYGGLIAEYNEDITKAETDLKTALGKADADHVKGLSDLASALGSMTITADCETLADTYAPDKAKYEEDVVASAVETLLERATALVTEHQNKIGARDKYTAEELGLSLDEVLAEYDNIVTALDGQNDIIDQARGQADAEAMATLNRVINALNNIQKDITEFQALVDDVKVKVKANNDAKTKADGVVKEIEELLNGDGAGVKGVAELNEDASRDQEFADMIAPLATKINEQKAAIAESAANETLVADWADAEGEGETVVEGIESKLEAIKADVEKAREAAEASTANYDAKAEIDKYVADKKMAETLAKAQTTVDEKTTEPAKTYFTGVIDSYEKQLADLQAKAQKAYNDRKCAEQKQEILDALKGLNTVIGGVAKNATDNETKHDGQLEKYNEVNKAWAKAYSDIATGDQTSAVQGYLEELTAEQTKLNAVKADIEKYFGEGQSAVQDEALNATLDAIDAKIKDIVKRQDDNYDEAVAADNKARYDAFLAAVKAAKDAYSAALVTIQDYSNITNSALTSAATEAVQVANTDINGLLGELRALESEVKTVYDAATGTTLFDPNEDYKAQAEGYSTKISNALTVLDNTVSSVARAEFSTSIADADGKLQAAIAELEAADYDETVVEEAFADVRKYIADAQAAEDGKDFALVVDQHLNNLGQTADLLVAGKEDAAKAEYAKRLGDINKKIEEQSANLQKWEYSGDPDGSQKQDYIDRYDAHVKATVDVAKEMYAAIEEGAYFDNMRAVKAQLDAFYTNNPYDDAYTASQNQEANKAAYAEVMKAHAELQPLFDKAAAFVDAYVIQTDCGLGGLQQRIDNVKADMDEMLVWGGCDNNKDYYLGECASIKSSIDGVYLAANMAEEEKIYFEIEALKGDQNKADDAVGDDAALIAEVEAYTKVIEDLGKDLDEWKAGEEFAQLTELQKQPGYLEYEEKIAQIRKELSAYYDANIGATTYNELLEALAAVEADYTAETEVLAGCHQNVVGEYQAVLDAVATDIAGIKEKLEGWNAEGSILFYKDKGEYYIKNTADALEALTKAIADAQAPYTANDNAYAKLTAEVDALTESLDAMVEKVSGYVFFDIETESNQEYIKVVREQIASSKKDLDERYAAISLDENSVIINKSAVEINIANFDKSATYYELDQTITSYDGENGLRGMAENLYNTVASNKYLPDTQSELLNGYYEVEGSRSALDTYNNEALTGTIRHDIDGNPLLDDQDIPTWQTIDYMEEAVPQITERIAALKEKIAALAETADTQAYILGDVNRDGEVRVDDYTRLINIALGTDVPEAETLAFYAADANEDGKLDIGDVTSVTNIILGVNTNGQRSAAAATADASNDVLSLTADDEGGIKHIAIKLASANAYVGCQMDVKLPAGVTLLNETLGGRATDHRLYSNTLADGTHRILISSMQNSEFNASEDVMVYLEVSGRAANRATVSGVLAADAAGMVYSVGGDGNDGATGIEGVEAEKSLKEKVYSIGGQVLDTLKRGVNIIRNADGTTKKVIKK